jgi:hypothetical protein
MPGNADGGVESAYMREKYSFHYMVLFSCMYDTKGRPDITRAGTNGALNRVPIE